MRRCLWSPQTQAQDPGPCGREAVIDLGSTHPSSSRDPARPETRLDLRDGADPFGPGKMGTSQVTASLETFLSESSLPLESQDFCHCLSPSSIPES